MKNIKQLWADPVWSKVIASIIVTIILACVALLWQNIWPFVQNYSKQLFDFLSWAFVFFVQNFFVILSVVLIGMLVFLSLRLFRLKYPTKVPSNTALEWFNSQTNETRYFPALLWFPVNRTLITPRYDTDTESLDHVPEVVDLIHNKALRIRRENVLQYSFQIDREVYRLLESEIHADDIPIEAKQLIEHLRQTDFLFLFPRRRMI
jgi:hypothetical protein